MLSMQQTSLTMTHPSSHFKSNKPSLYSSKTITHVFVSRINFINLPFSVFSWIDIIFKLLLHDFPF